MQVSRRLDEPTRAYQAGVAERTGASSSPRPSKMLAGAIA
jgi:hypothetical protein